MAEKLGKMLSLKQVASELGVHECTVTKLMKRDKSFPLIRVGRGRFYMRESSLVEWIAAKERERKAN